MSRKNKSTEFINDCIADALLQLMEEKPIEKITAQEITDLAGVGRATFFRHFHSKDDILTYKLIRLWNQWVINHNLSQEGHFSLSNTEDLLAFNLSIRPLIYRIYSAGMQHAIYMAFYQVMEPYFSFEPLHNYTSKFYAYGVFALLDEWIKRDFAETPKQIADIVVHQIVGKDVPVT